MKGTTNPAGGSEGEGGTRSGECRAGEDHYLVRMSGRQVPIDLDPNSIRGRFRGSRAGIAKHPEQGWQGKASRTGVAGFKWIPHTDRTASRTGVADGSRAGVWKGSRAGVSIDIWQGPEQGSVSKPRSFLLNVPL